VRAAPPRLVDLVQEFLADGTRCGLSLATCAARRVALAGLLRFLARRGLRALARVRDRDLIDWAAYVRDRSRVGYTGCPGYSPGTIELYLLVTRRFFAWLVRRGTLLLDPTTFLGERRARPDAVAHLEIPTETQIQNLLANIPETGPLALRDRAIVELAYSSGLRSAELRNLNVSDIDLGQLQVWIREGKGRKDRVVPLGRPAARAVVSWLDAGRPLVAKNAAEQALFLTQGGRRLGQQTFRARLLVLRARSGLPRLRTHDLRHASALHMLRRGADVSALQEFLGHTDVTTTQIYTRLVPADLKDAHRKTHPRERHKDRS